MRIHLIYTSIAQPTIASPQVLGHSVKADVVADMRPANLLARTFQSIALCAVWLVNQFDLSMRPLSIASTLTIQS